ncbi:hypothetical protein DYB37_008640 [Aphanomyces astaci]|uniref:Uncharacterized protein n=1 Tax=Aphanomyces astaci TaxID=112090 RepID=A0A3R7EVJ2_APHAT|nr:hypothetical protein DYB37_008640 [Aphanomyces astaci]
MEKRHVLSPAEKWLIVKCHQYFIEHKALNLPGKQARVRDSVSKCLGFAKSTYVDTGLVLPSNTLQPRYAKSYPSSDMAELERRLKIHFAEVTSSQWLSAHDKSCSFENAYMEAAEDVILAQEEEPSDDGEGNLLDVSSESE